MQMKFAVGSAILGLLLMGNAAQAQSSWAPEGVFPAATCPDSKGIGDAVDAPRLAYVATLDGSLELFSDSHRISHTCGSEICSARVLLGYLIPYGLEVTQMTFRISDPQNDMTVEAGLLNRQNGQLDPIVLDSETVPYAVRGILELQAADVPVGDPEYQQCGWIEIQITLERPVCGTCGDDTLALPDVTLGPR